MSTINAARVAQFEKVSFEQFKQDMLVQSGDLTEDDIRAIYDQIELPSRATSGSAGYDFFTPIWFELYPGESITIPTGIRCRMTDGWALKIYPKSGLGTKNFLRIANTIPIVDADYYYSDNEGHIFLKLRNESNETRLTVDRGKGVAQGIFEPFGITLDDQADGVRNGGFGSTGA